MLALPSRPSPGLHRLRLSLRRRRQLRSVLGAVRLLGWLLGSAALTAIALLGLMSLR